MPFCTFEYVGETDVARFGTIRTEFMSVSSLPINIEEGEWMVSTI